MITYLTCTAYSKNAPAGETPNIMTPDIHDITSPEEFLLGQPPLWQSPWFWVLVITGILLMGFVLRKFTRQKTNQKKRKQLLEKATEALSALKAEIDSLKPQTSAVRISLIMRQYLEAAFEDPALFETDEELTLRPHALAQLQHDCRTAVIDHLHKLTQLKYVEAGQQGPILELIDQAIEVLHMIEPATTDQKAPEQKSPDQKPADQKAPE